MSARKSRFDRRARGVLIWTAAAFVVAQIMGALGLYWLAPKKRDAETIVREDRFSPMRHGNHRVPSLDESIIQWQFHHLYRVAGPQEVILVGDSSCLMGVVPQRIRAATGRSVWNFGLIGSLSTEGAAEILEAYLRKHGPPQLVVCQVTPATLRRSTAEIERIGSLRALQAWLYDDETGGGDRNPLMKLPPYRLRPALYEFVSDALFGPRPAEFFAAKRGVYPSDDELRETLVVSCGYLREAQTLELPEVETDFDDLPCPDSLPALVRMFEMTDRHAVRFLLTMSPRPESHRSPALEEAYDRLEAQLRSLAKPYRFVTISSRLLRYFPDEEFATIHHLRETGALRNSDEMSRLILSQLQDDDSWKPQSSPESADVVSSEEQVAASVAMRLLIWAR